MRICKTLVLLLLVCTSISTAEPLIVAHRGASKAAPENTIPAFQLAWQLHADAIEGDFYLSKDGKIVCIHDRMTKKVADKNIDVSKSTLAQLKKLDVGIKFHKDYAGTTIPTIAEVFACIPEGKKIYIEIKCGPEIIATLLEEIKKSGLKKEQIVVISFKTQVIQKLKAEAPQYTAYWLSRLKKDKSGKVTPSLTTVLSVLEKIKADGFHSGKDIIDEAFIKHIRKKGFEYHVWTIDDVETAKRFKNWGAMSITTNIPGHIKKHLVKNKDSSD
ncbi:MAG: glycerophosphodiester phosphodiesterase [Planctomycetes bacterium]|nr:glycerophosphodiester phosphodiesterase [Planctomycetota bacterium]